jgi:hypothetical protein
VLFLGPGFLPSLPGSSMTGFYRDVLILCAVGLATYGGLWAFTGITKSTPAQRLAALKEEVKTKGGEVFETTLQGKPLAFLLQDCQLFLLDTAGDPLTRTKVLGPDFYLGPTVCTAQTIGVSGEYLKVYLANQAIGAGGGNITGGNYRSKDGLVWEKLSGKDWLASEQ